MEYALRCSRKHKFPSWYQEIVREADLATNSPVRGCMIIRPNGYGIWQRIQYLMNIRIEETGHENLYFPLFIPFGFITDESEHVEGFAKEMALVTHTRLIHKDGAWIIDPSSRLKVPLVVRPTSETIITHHFKKCVRSYRDLPLLWNQWANVVRWEMRTRLFLRTAEFLWQEGHTAHADSEGAIEETRKMLEVYRSFAEDVLAIPVIAGEKPAHERFPGAENTYSIEAMMQDGKALQAGTSHYLGTTFSKQRDIQYVSRTGEKEYCHTTSWGVSTRLIGAVIMSHGDDDGLRAPPRIAPRQVVIVPMMRSSEDGAAVLAYCEELKRALQGQVFAGEQVRVHLDTRDGRSADKRWGWIKRGAPVICEIGARDAQSRQVSFYRRDLLRREDKLDNHGMSLESFVEGVPALLEAIHDTLFAEAKARLDANIVEDLGSWEEVQAHFGPSDADELGSSEADEDGEIDAEDEAIEALETIDDAVEATRFRGWARVAWRRPQGDEIERIKGLLKELNISIRIVLPNANPSSRRCIFTGEAADEELLIARAY